MINKHQQSQRRPVEQVLLKETEQIKMSFDQNFPVYSIIQLIVMTPRLIFAGIIMCSVIIFQQYVRPRIMIPSVRRYLSCIVNLICIRLVLLIFGFIKFQCQNYRYFDKMQQLLYCRSRMLTFRSGWVGVVPWRNFIDFLYFSYLFSPVFVRVIQYHPDNVQQNKNTGINKQIKVFYTPMSFKQSFFAALSYRGFDPIIIKGEKQLKKIKRRKMLLPTLISQCFQQLNGPILIFSPSISRNQQIKMHKTVGSDIYDNQKRFLRSGLIFIPQIQQIQSNIFSIITNPLSARLRKIPKFAEKNYNSQLVFLADLCSKLQLNIYTVIAIQTIKYKLEYTKESCAQFIDETYMKYGKKTIPITYEQYNDKLNEIQLKQSICKDGKKQVQGNENIISLSSYQRQQNMKIKVDKKNMQDFKKDQQYYEQIKKQINQLKWIQIKDQQIVQVD